MSDELQTDPPKPGPKLSTSASPPQGEASIPLPSTPASTGCLLPYSDELLSARSFPWLFQPACTRGANADPW